MNSSHMSGSSSSKPLICIYTNNEKNEFAIGFREDENFRAITATFIQDLLMLLRVL